MICVDELSSSTRLNTLFIGMPPLFSWKKLSSFLMMIREKTIFKATIARRSMKMSSYSRVKGE
jgi:hypothetical protein